MSRVIDHNAEWFQEVAPRDFYIENDLERVIILNLELIFPEFIAFQFKKKLLNNNTRKKSAPDLGLVKSDYSEWYIIEVELGKHSLAEVLEQIGTFRNCTYDASHAKYIYDKRPTDFDLKQLTNLITSKAPELMVIVNEQKADWKADLTNLKCKMCVFQIYNDFRGRTMYRLNGEHPFIFTDFCNCKYEKQVPYAVKVLSSDFLDSYGISNGSNVLIEYEGISHLWERQDAGSEVFLICKNKLSPLDPKSYRYRLNYNALSVRKVKRGNFFQNLIIGIKNAVRPSTLNIFSFTKD